MVTKSIHTFYKDSGTCMKQDWMVTLGTTYTVSLITNRYFQKGYNIKLYVSRMCIHSEGAVNL